MIYITWTKMHEVETLILVSTNRVDKGEYYVIAEIFKKGEYYSAKINEVIFPSIKQRGNLYETLESAKTFVMDCLQESLDELFTSFIYQIKSRGEK